MEPDVWFCVESMKHMGMGMLLWRRCPTGHPIASNGYRQCNCSMWWGAPHIFQVNADLFGLEPHECGPIFSEEKALQWLKIHRQLGAINQRVMENYQQQLSAFQLPHSKTENDIEVEQGMDRYGY